MQINNAVYNTLNERWLYADDDPIALLRAECRLRNPWVSSRIWNHFNRPVRTLDIGCGAGFLSNELARQGHSVVGIDLAQNALGLARTTDKTGTALYQVADARKLPFDDASFEVVCAMDVLEHVEPWQSLVAEAARVLRPGGIFFFYTFNRTFLAWLFAVKGVEWVVKNTPRGLHLHRLFIKPKELDHFCQRVGLQMGTLKGVAPHLFSWNGMRLLQKGTVPEGFEFRFTTSTRVAYLGDAVKRS